MGLVAGESLAPLLGAARGAQPWAIDPAVLPLQLDAPRSFGPDAGAGELQRQDGTGGVAVLRADGIVLPRCDPHYERWGYAVSCEGLAGRVEQAAADGVAAILIAFDSPGGSVSGVAEAVARIAAVAKTLPVVAVADHFAASAAYQLAVACTAVVASPSAMVGSVGVYVIRVGIARALDDEGIDVDVPYRGEGKLDLMPLVALDDAGRDRLQGTVDAYYADFVAAVAAGRGVARSVVMDDWGAQVLTAQAARRRGMVDAVATAAATYGRLQTAAGRRAYLKMGAARALASAQMH